MTVDISSRIALARRRQGLTQSELAVRVGISRAYVARIETGHHRPPLPTLLAFARALDLSPRTLLTTQTEDNMEPRHRPRNEREEEIAKAYGSASYENALADILAVLHGEDLEPTRSTKRRQLRAATLEADDERVKRVARIVATATVKLCRSLQKEGRRIPRRLKIRVKKLELLVQAKVKAKRTIRSKKPRANR
jgi:transcriptional regulator with XRE-family HTH domain